jgi:hypothetical protein
VSEMTLRGNPELSRVAVSTAGMELSKVVSSIGPQVHKGAKGKGFRGNIGKNVQRMSGNNVREVRDHSNAVPGIRNLI